MCFLHFTLLMENYLQPCPSCFTSFPTNSQAKNSILSTNLDQMGNKASINIPSSIRQYLSTSTEKHFNLPNYTSEDNKKLRASRIMLGSGEDVNEPTSTKRDMYPTYQRDSNNFATFQTMICYYLGRVFSPGSNQSLCKLSKEIQNQICLSC